MLDILLVLGLVLCVLSVVLAIISVIRTRAPRGAAITLVCGLVLMLFSAWMDNRDFALSNFNDSLRRLTNLVGITSRDPNAD